MDYNYDDSVRGEVIKINDRRNKFNLMYKS